MGSGVHPESFTSELLGIHVQNATSGGHGMNVLNWILANYGNFKTAFLDPRVCEIAFRGDTAMGCC